MRVNRTKRLRKTAEELLNEVNVINFDEDKKSSTDLIIETILNAEKMRDGDTRKKLYRIEASFDNETTNYKDHGYIWIWQFGLGDKFFFGRYWEDFAELMVKVSNLIESDLLVGIANAGFDLSFYNCFFKDLETEDTHTYEQINAAPHQPIISELKAKGKKASVKFLDICKISNMKLADIAENYCVHKKLVGTLDYNKIRTPQTTIKRHELAYSIFDVVVANEYMDYLFKEFTEQGEKFPVTATSICRQKVKIESEKEEYETIKSKVAKELFPKSYKEYEQVVKYLFRGGFTHANHTYINQILHNVTCADYTSSYPSEMVYQKYPMSEFTRLEDAEGVYECKDGELPQIKIFYDKHFCCKCEITLYNMQARFSHTIESEHKAMDLYPNPISGKKTHECDNGRIYRASKAKFFVTELDYDIMKKFYYADKIEINNFYISEAGKLPDYITKPLIEMYAKKSLLKKQKKQGTAEYVALKGMINSFYGMMVQKLKMFSDVLERKYDEDFNYYYQYSHIDNAVKLKNKKEKFLDYTYEQLQDAEYYIQKRDKILSVYWGVWVTAYARHKLLSQVYEIEQRSLELYHCESVVYCDTDSMYIKNIDRFRDIIDKYNDETEEKNIKMLPANCEDLNTLDIDPTCKYFKTLGAKRYVKTYFDKKKCEEVTKVTVAGLPKTALLEFCDYNRDRVYEEFNDKMIIDKSFSHKFARTCKYEKYEAEITDYEGNTMLCRQYGGCVLKEVDFSLDASDILKFVECYCSRQG